MVNYMRKGYVPRGRFSCARGTVLLTHFGRRKLLTCRFGENRRSLHRPVQKLLTARLPTAFKPAAATAAFFRFPTSPTGSAAMVTIVLSCLKENDRLPAVMRICYTGTMHASSYPGIN